ncbi:MAG TPA: AsmA-like C-terminal region-containing protein, partial [Bacteroidales bacterium]|nr:AsmA-like C-terminal region-containing protein [Bacteroidales bacterium]
INIKHLFRSMNNFGQEFIISDNIAGNINGNSEVVLPVGPNFRFTTSDLSAENNITITDGELIDFQPMIETYSFLNIEEPEHIRFSTLENNLIISDNEITIPEMEIRSSAINLNASGVHTFNKTYKYHLALRLSELLYKKVKMNSNEEFRISEDPDDTRTVFLRLYNEGEGMKVEFDEEQAIMKVRNDLREEKLELQKVLKEEFSRKDISHDKEINDADNSQPVFEFEFGVEDTVVEDKPKKETRKKWWK